MSAFLFGKTVDQLSALNQTSLVWFIITFPFVVLSVFAWLVCRHHTKLYGPSDFRTDEGFLSAGKEVGRDLQRKIEFEEEAGQVDSGGQVVGSTRKDPKVDSSNGPSPEQKINQLIFGTKADATSKIARAYLAEGLVFQALQQELRGSVRREVVLSGSVVDGLIYESDGSVTIVEVKILSPGSKELARRLRDCKAALDRAVNAFKSEVGGNPNPLLAIAVDGTADDAAEMKSRMKDGSFPFRSRVYSLAELMKQYGFEDVRKE
jgi:hypothetical protein